MRMQNVARAALLLCCALGILVYTGSAQMNCVGQPEPPQPANACFNRSLQCLCGSNNFDCHWQWTCKPAPPPAPQKTVEAPASTPSGNVGPVGGLLNGTVQGLRLRQQRQQTEQSQKQEDAAPSYMTAGAFNGNFWMKFDPAIKSAFVSGFMEAVNASLSNEDRRRYVGKGTVGDTVGELDLFYRENPGNRNFPIWLAVHCVNLLASGTPEDQIPKVLEAEGIVRGITPAKQP